MLKRVLTLLVLGLGLAGATQAQLIGIGFRFGATYGTPVAKPRPGATGSPGVADTKGVFFRFNIPGIERWSLQTGAAFLMKRATFSTPISGDTVIFRFVPGVGNLPFPADYSGVVDGVFRNYYAEVPLMAHYDLNETWSFHAGFYGAYLLYGDNSGLADLELGNNFDFREDEPFDQSEFLNPIDFGLVAGIDYYMGDWLFDLRGTVGLRSIYQNDYLAPGGTVRNVYLQFSLGRYFDRPKPQE